MKQIWVRFDIDEGAWEDNGNLVEDLEDDPTNTFYEYLLEDVDRFERDGVEIAWVLEPNFVVTTVDTDSVV